MWDQCSLCRSYRRPIVCASQLYISMVICAPMLTHVVQGNSEHAPDLAISQSTVGGACWSIKVYAFMCWSYSMFCKHGFTGMSSITAIRGCNLLSKCPQGVLACSQSGHHSNVFHIISWSKQGRLIIFDWWVINVPFRNLPQEYGLLHSSLKDRKSVV